MLTKILNPNQNNMSTRVCESEQDMGGASAPSERPDPQQTGNPAGGISQSIKSLRRKHPRMSGRTVLSADTAQVKAKTTTYESSHAYII